MELTEPAPTPAGTSLQPVAPGYKHVLRLRTAVTWGMLWAAGSVADRVFFLDDPLYGLLTVAILMFGAIAVAFAPERIYRRLRYGLTDRLLQVMRGWLFHVDTMVPLVRVQHIDVTRGPFDKLFGTANLIIHTAGTHNSIVTVPGLLPERAAEIRDIIREHVRSDFA